MFVRKENALHEDSKNTPIIIPEGEHAHRTLEELHRFCERVGISTDIHMSDDAVVCSFT